MSSHRGAPDGDYPQGWGPTMKGGAGGGVADEWGAGRDRRTWPRVLGVGGLLIVLLVAGIGLYAWTRIDRVEVGGRETGTGPLHVLVVGSDSRENLTPEQRRELSTGSASGERTDTILLMVIDGGQAGLLAFPRDMYVTRCDGSEGRINAAQAIGGPGCLVETVSDVSGIPIDHYMSVNFLGFRDLVNAVGGVELCLEEPIQDDDAGIDLPAGCQRLDGGEALGYVRVRKIDSDLERIKRQQQFLGALSDRMTSVSTLLNPIRLTRTAGEAGSALTTDTGLGPLALFRIGWGGRALAGGGAPLRTVPVEGTTIGGAAVLRLQEDQAAGLFQQFRTGAILDQARQASDGGAG